MPEWLPNAGLLNWLTAIGGFLLVMSLTLLLGPRLLIGVPPPEVAIISGVFLMVAAASLGLLVTLLIAISLCRHLFQR